jgi:hypothetical protein
MTLLDDVKDLPISKWTGNTMPTAVAKRVQALAPKARQFVFDEQASFFLGQFIRDCPDVLINHMQFAVQPYETTYIEIDLQAVYRGTGTAHTGQYYPDPDKSVGFLAHAGTVYTLANTADHPGAGLSQICIMDNEYATHPVDNFIDDSRVLLGTTWYDLNDAQREAFAQRFNVGCLAAPEYRQKVLEIMVPATMGEARVYLAALLLLFNRQRWATTDHSFRRAALRGKFRTFMAYTSVTIHLTAYDRFKRDLERTGARSTPRRHEVRTHYRHRHLTPGCEHQWVPVEEAENKQWRCSCCSGLRYLCREHLRGDASVGFVAKTYEVRL